MRTFRYLITAEDAGDQIQHFLRFKQGISRKVVISLKHLPEGILLNGAHARTIDLLREGDTLEINLPDQARKLPPCEIDVPRLYWDRDVAVCRCISLAGTSSARWPAYMPPCAKKRATAAPFGR